MWWGETKAKIDTSCFLFLASFRDQGLPKGMDESLQWIIYNPWKITWKIKCMFVMSLFKERTIQLKLIPTTFNAINDGKFSHPFTHFSYLLLPPSLSQQKKKEGRKGQKVNLFSDSTNTFSLWLVRTIWPASCLGMATGLETEIFLLWDDQLGSGLIWFWFSLPENVHRMMFHPRWNKIWS